jgi:hypothetical protein
MDLDVDRLILEFPGLSEAEARHLAGLVAVALASMDTPAAALVVDRLRVPVPLRPGEPLPATAERIARGVVSALTRSSS